MKKNYICKECGEILHPEDIVRHIIASHDSNWRGSLYEAKAKYRINITNICSQIMKK